MRVSLQLHAQLPLDAYPRLTGRALARLGLEGLAAEQFRDLFARGWDSPLWPKVVG